MVRDDLHFFWDFVKIIGGTVIDTLDVGDYKITIVIERKIDNKIGLVVENMTVDKKMSALEVKMISRRLKEIIEKNR